MSSARRRPLGRAHGRASGHVEGMRRVDVVRESRRRTAGPPKPAWAPIASPASQLRPKSRRLRPSCAPRSTEQPRITANATTAKAQRFGLSRPCSLGFAGSEPIGAPRFELGTSPTRITDLRSCIAGKVPAVRRFQSSPPRPTFSVEPGDFTALRHWIAPSASWPNGDDPFGHGGVAGRVVDAVRRSRS